MSDLSVIEETYGITLPAGYRYLHQNGCLEHPNPAYLWLHEAEWIPVNEVSSHRILSYGPRIDGLVPFARSGAGDTWCWQVNQPTSDHEYQIWFCWHDEDHADIYAPTFAAWLYRSCLDYLRVEYDDFEEGCSLVQQWSQVLTKLGDDEGAHHLLTLAQQDEADGFIDDDEAEEVILRRFGSDYVGKRVVWQLSPYRQVNAPSEAELEEMRKRAYAERQACEFTQATNQADEAFRAGDFAAYVSLMTPFQDMLSPAQLKKLSIAARKANPDFKR